MNFRKFYTNSLYILVAASVFACGTPVDQDDPGTLGDDPSSGSQIKKNDQIQKIFSSIPSQTETTEMLENAGARYNAKALNPIENVSKYSTNKAKALNLGIYGIDLGVTNIFDQTQESVLYLKCTNQMAKSLGISGAFDENMSARLDANSDNKDSLLAIITDSYRTADSHLQENGQPGISTLMVVGAWIEGMYIASQIATETKNEAIINRIGKEKTNLNDLIGLLESYKTENQGTEEVIESLSAVKAVFDTTTDDKLTPEQFKQIADKISEIRTKIIL
ncbi:MAG: hypothetical protein WAQ28_13520 [Bacteroidia bacterium]|jgi:hypothetical protein